MKFNSKEQIARFGIALDKERLKNALMALVVIVAVGGTFLYLFNKDTYQESLMGSFLGSLLFDRSSEEEEESVEEVVVDYQEAYEEEAQAGEGLTHVARRVLDKHLEKEGIDDFSAEQKVFMEDYIQKKLGSHSLDLGEKVSISQELISQAMEEADLLTESQLNNLSQYSSLVPSLQ